MIRLFCVYLYYKIMQTMSNKFTKDNLDANAIGDCYDVHGKFLLDNVSSLKLVHGMVTGQGNLSGIRYGHCWLEDDQNVIDLSMNKKLVLEKSIYYALGKINPSECKIYTSAEMTKKVFEHQHWGPWDMTGDTEYLENNLQNC